MIEPILTYNCEIAQAYIPKAWNYTKFKHNMWKIGDTLNKVIIGFLRQLLGVHKKTTNMAIQAETGKNPISIKIFISIIKYWLRLFTCENKLLIEARKVNMEQYQNGQQSWMRIVQYLLQVTNMQEINPSENIKENNKISTNFQQKINSVFKEWWETQAIVSGENKLDFYYKYKKAFNYETYLDNVPKHLRIHMTRLRTSSHILPIEVQRYKKIKVNRENRKCQICNLVEMGDEEHYLLRCNNINISNARNSFFEKIRKDISQFDKFTNNNIIDYCMNMSDINIQMPMAIYVKNILSIYKEEVEGTHNNPENITTRYGRLSKRPIKLNL